MAGLGLELLGRRSSALGNSVWWQKSLCVWGLWLSTLDSKRFDLKLTMAHNQDRLQNSDSSVVYGHGHIIYSHTASRCSLSPVWRGRHTITTSHQTANYEFEWPSSKTHLFASKAKATRKETHCQIEELLFQVQGLLTTNVWEQGYHTADFELWDRLSNRYWYSMKDYEMYCRIFLQCDVRQDYFKRSLREIVKRRLLLNMRNWDSGWSRPNSSTLNARTYTWICQNIQFSTPPSPASWIRMNL